MYKPITLIIETDHVATVLECLQLGKEAYVINGLPIDARNASNIIEAIQSECIYQSELHHQAVNNYMSDF